jgi:phospholipase/carboxylesterase
VRDVRSIAGKMCASFTMNIDRKAFRTMTLETIDIETGLQPCASIIFMHGLGADGNDFVPFAQELNLRSVGPIRFVFPHAPTRPVTINGGYVMRAWYDILERDLVIREDEAGFRTSQKQVEALIDKERARGIPSGRIVLGGFSQGCAMALLTGLRQTEALAGIAALSGYLPLAARSAAESTTAGRATPIFMAHGRVDPVIALERSIASRDALRQLGCTVEWHEYPMPHSVCPQEVADLTIWLKTLLK